MIHCKVSKDDLCFNAREHKWPVDTIFQKIFIKGQFLQLNEDLVWERTIGHSPQREERTLETLSCSRNPTQ